jgi:pyruvate/2-oxoglutarate dehydrogenase complex dihydrolipoamide dehydrogenase (E3) component
LRRTEWICWLKASQVELVLGEGRFVAPRTVVVQGEERASRVISAKRVVLNRGTRALIPDIPGLAAARAITHVEALELNHVPSHLVVLGGGYVGLELAQAFRRFGSNVTIIEQGAQLAGREDPDLGAEIASLLAEAGIDIVTMVRILRVEGQSGIARTPEK